MQGSLKDLICRNKQVKSHYLKKYLPAKPIGLQFDAIQRFGRQILEGLQFLQAKDIPYFHLHTGNVMMVPGRGCMLSDVENGLLQLTPLHHDKICRLRSLTNAEDINMYCFAHVLYEMAVGSPLATAVAETIPPSIPAGGRSLSCMSPPCHTRVARTLLPSSHQCLVLSSVHTCLIVTASPRRVFTWMCVCIFFPSLPRARSLVAAILERMITPAGVQDMLSLEDLLEEQFFSTPLAGGGIEKPSFKVSTRAKEALKASADAFIQRVVEEQERLDRQRKGRLKEADRRKKEERREKERSRQVVTSYKVRKSSKGVKVCGPAWEGCVRGRSRWTGNLSTCTPWRCISHISPLPYGPPLACATFRPHSLCPS